MLDVFVDAFSSAFIAVAKILIVALAAGIAMRRKIISDEHVKMLSMMTVRFFLPCLIFSSIIRQFHPDQFKIWPILPLSAIAMTAVGLISAKILFWGTFSQKKNMFAIASLNNAGYLVLPIGAVLFPAEYETFKLYCFLYILGASTILWSLGKYLITHGSETKFKISGLLTPPLIAILAGLCLVFTGARVFVPSLLLDPVELIGSATVPLATIILGAMLGGISLRFSDHIFDAARAALIKLCIIPAVVIAVLYWTQIDKDWPLLAVLLVIQASAAPAMAFILQVKHYGGDEQKVGSAMMLCYVSYIITMPFWMAVWQIISR